MATRTFRGTINSNWNNAGNWLELAVPTNADDVVFDALSPACVMDVNGSCLTLTMTGFLATLSMVTFSLLVAGTTFTLEAACYVKGTASPELDFTAAAGTVLITTAANEVNGVRVGNVATGATYQPQDALTITLDLDCVRGIFSTNNQTITIKRDLLWKATLAASSFKAGASTVEIRRNLTISKADVMLNSGDYGTSQFRMTGTGAITPGLSANVNFYDLHVGEAGLTTSLALSGGVTQVTCNHRLTGGTGSFVQTGGINNFRLFSSIADAFVPNPAFTMRVSMDWRINTGVTIIAELQPCIYNVAGVGTGRISLTTVYDVVRTLGWKMMADIVFIGELQLRETGITGAGSVRTFDFNGFDLTVTGAFVSGDSLIGRGHTVLVDGNTLTCTSYSHWGMHAVNVLAYGTRVTAGGSIVTTGNVVIDDLSATGVNRVNLTGTGLIKVGGNWASSATGNLVFVNPDLGTVSFLAPAAFTIAARSDEMWPTVSVSGGGSCTLYAGFNCYDLLVFSGALTTAGDLIVRHSYNAGVGGSLTLGGDMYIGSGFVNAGTVISAGFDIVTTGALVSISGVNPNSIVMTAQTIRLQLLTAMTIGTLTVEDRITPGVIQFLAGGLYTIATLDSQIVRRDTPVQCISSSAGTQYTWTVAAVTSVENLWPRDNLKTGAPIVGNLSNVDLGNNTGWTLNGPGLIRVITDDPGQIELAASGFGLYEYCWLVDTSLAGLTAQAAAFALGTDNWHRRVNIPLAVLDNLNPGTTYYIALGLRDENDQRLAPDVGGGDFITDTADGFGVAGDLESVVNTPGNVYGG